MMMSDAAIARNAPYDLTIDFGGDRFPVSGPTPRLSWKPALASEEWEIEAVVDGAPQSAAVSGGHLFVEWPWASLGSRQRVVWRVRAAEGGDWSGWSAFEAGLFDGDWQSRWISPAEADQGPGGSRGVHALAVSFEVHRQVKAARLYSTALGIYEAFVNDERAGSTELSPGSTSYDRTLYGQAFDVTSALRSGTNRLELLLADGWYRGQVGAHRAPAAWGTALAARAELHLDLADGTRQVIRTDDTWKSTTSQVTRADLMDGQTVDLTAAASAPQKVLVDQVSGPAIDWSPAPPVRVVESRAPVRVAAIRDGVWVADFGQNASGWIALSDLGPAGTRTTIDYGEYVAADGDLSTSHLNSVRPGEPEKVFVQRDEVVSAGGEDEFEPRLTVHGFRYARITRESAGPTELDPGSVTMRVVHTDLRRTGTFACSDRDLNRLHEVVDWSFRGNAVDVPTDCPTRERLAWTGDYQVFAPTATRLYDVLGFSRKWLRSVRDDQLEDGRIANFSPDGRRIKDHLDDQFALMTGSAGWGDAIVAVPWEMYLSYGDRKVLSENWVAMSRWVEWALSTARTARHPSRVQRSAEPLPHEKYIWDGSFHWGEWIEPKEKDDQGSPIDPIKTNPAAWFMADKGEVGTAFLHRSVRTLACIAEVLDRGADAVRYGLLSELILDAWRTEFLREDGRTAGDTQASYVRALSFGLIPEDLRPAAASRLVELIENAGMHLGTGFLSTGDLLPVLADTGHVDVAYALLLQRTAPSWLYMLDHGATTIWEEWEGIDVNGAAHASLNHYSKGAVIRFLHSHVLGLAQEAGSDAWRSVVIAPRPGGGLTWARGTYESPQGQIRVQWRATESELEIEALVPVGTSARIVFPDGAQETVGPGRHVRRRPRGAVR